MKRRQGFTLIEMLLTMSVGSLLMVLAMTLLQQAMTLSSQTRSQCDADRVIHRLCEQFRRDAHSASAVSTDDQLVVTLVGDSKNIVYRFLNSTVTRSTSGESIENEQYDLGKSANVTIEMLEQPEQIRLTVLREPKLKHIGPRIERQIALTVGRFAVKPSREETQP
jgi:prepilin-type N-terminal cleavage/methylation domain-containing protein